MPSSFSCIIWVDSQDALSLLSFVEHLQRLTLVSRRCINHYQRIVLPDEMVYDFADKDKLSAHLLCFTKCLPAMANFSSQYRDTFLAEL